MVSNVKLERELYIPMCKWLQDKLEDRYKRERCEIIIEDSHLLKLDKILEKNGVLNYFPQTVGLDIQIDVVGIVKWNSSAKLFFIEAKKTMLNLHDLGQLWAYCKLCDPEEAYLLSSLGLGSLSKILITLRREDLLNFGLEKKIKMMKVAKWDITRNTIDNNTIIPKL